MTIKRKYNKTKKNKRLNRKTRRRTNKKFSKKMAILKKYKMKTKRFIGGEPPTEEEEEFMTNYIIELDKFMNLDLRVENYYNNFEKLKNEVLSSKDLTDSERDLVMKKSNLYLQYIKKFKNDLIIRKKTKDNETILLKKFEERIDTMKKNGEDTGEKYEKLLAKTTELKESISQYDAMEKIIINGSRSVLTTRNFLDMVLPKEESAWIILDTMRKFNVIEGSFKRFLNLNINFLSRKLPYDKRGNVLDTAFLYALKRFDKVFMILRVIDIFNEVKPATLNESNSLNQNAIFIEVVDQKFDCRRTVDKMIIDGVNPNTYGNIILRNTPDDGNINELYIPPIILAIFFANSLYHDTLKTNDTYLNFRYGNSKECIRALLFHNVNVTDKFLYKGRNITPLEFVVEIVSDADIILLFLEHLKKLNTEIELLKDETIIDSFLSKNSKYNEIKASYYILKENQKKITEQKKEKQLTEQEKRAEQIRKQLLQEEEEEEKQEKEKKKKEKKEKKKGSKETTPLSPSPTNIPITPKNTPITTPINVPSLGIEENTGFIPISIDAPPVVVVNYDKLITEDYARIYEDSNDITEAIDFLKKYSTAEQLYKFKEVLQTTFSGKFEPTLPDDIVNFELFSLFEKCIGFLSKLFYEKTLCLLLIKGSEATRKILRIETTPENYTDLDIMIVPLKTNGVLLKTISKNIAVYIKYVATSISRRDISYILPDNYKIVKVSARQTNRKFKAILDIDYNYDELLPYIKELYSNENVVMQEGGIGSFVLSYNCLGLRSILKEKMYYIVKYTNYSFLQEAVSRSTPTRNDPNVYYLNKTSSQLNKILEIMVKGREENIKKKTELKKEKLEKKKLENTGEVIGESPEISLKSKTKEYIMSEYWEDVIQANLRENDRLYIPEPFLLGLYITRNDNLSFIMVYPDSKVSITIPKN